VGSSGAWMRVTGLAAAIYGVILLLVIFVMPSGAAGFTRLAAAYLARFNQARNRFSDGRTK